MVSSDSCGVPSLLIAHQSIALEGGATPRDDVLLPPTSGLLQRMQPERRKTTLCCFLSTAGLPQGLCRGDLIGFGRRVAFFSSSAPPLYVLLYHVRNGIVTF